MIDIATLAVQIRCFLRLTWHLDQLDDPKYNEPRALLDNLCDDIINGEEDGLGPPAAAMLPNDHPGPLTHIVLIAPQPNRADADVFINLDQCFLLRAVFIKCTHCGGHMPLVTTSQDVLFRLNFARAHAQCQAKAVTSGK